MGVGKIIAGISSWSDSSLLKSGFYPREAASPTERLRYYSSQFSLTESDASYHVIPFGGNIQTWIGATPAHFIFDLKAFSLFSGHPTPLNSLPRNLREAASAGLKKSDRLYINHLPGAAADALWQRFSQVIYPLQQAKKLGFVMFQYPPWFHPTPQNIDYVKQCKAKLRDFQLGVEFRTPDWLDEKHLPATLDLLRSEELTLVCVDEPQGLKTSIPPIAETTSQFAVVRFHGRNSQAWEDKESAATSKYDYLYSKEELEEWLPRIRRLQERSSVLHLIFKNKHLDHPAVNARQMLALLDGRES
jgi:uncharacterized protein YecE (DUF72 family)